VKSLFPSPPKGGEGRAAPRTQAPHHSLRSGTGQAPRVVRGEGVCHNEGRSPEAISFSVVDARK